MRPFEWVPRPPSWLHGSGRRAGVPPPSGIPTAMTGLSRILSTSGKCGFVVTSISGLVVEYIVAIDVTRVRFPADAFYGLRARSLFS